MARSVRFEFNPFEELGIDELSRSSRGKALDDAAEYLREQILDYVASQKSPVEGYGRFQKLSENYAKLKSAKGGAPIPNLELSGAMLDALAVKRRGSNIVVEIKGKQGDKADGHNNHSGDSRLPLRRFIPDEGEIFKSKIMGGISEIIEGYAEEGD